MDLQHRKHSLRGLGQKLSVTLPSNKIIYACDVTQKSSQKSLIFNFVLKS
jgi:hypothetical protein